MPSKTKLGLIVAGVAIIGIGMWMWSRAGASETKPDARRAQTVSVSTATVELKDLPIQVRAIGQVEASSTVDVHSQANGQLTRINFKEGDFVQKGTPLFNIDPRVSQTDVAGARANYERAIASQRQSEANLAKDRSVAANAEAIRKRYAQLVDSGVVSQVDYDQYRTNAETANATVKADQDAVNSEKKNVAAAQAALDASQVQLGFTSINAPIAGKTGAFLVHQGDIVAANDQNPLVVIAQIQPIYVTFSVPETDFVQLKQAMPSGALVVEAAPAADPNTTSKGTLSFMDNTVDATTGTIKMKASFENADQRLWPGQFVNVVVTLGTQHDAVAIPKIAIQTGQQGTYVFVVGSDSTVQMRPVQVERTINDMSVISSGLERGERIVTDGQLKLTPGSKVTEGGAAGSNGASGAGAPAGAAPAAGNGGAAGSAGAAR